MACDRLSRGRARTGQRTGLARSQHPHDSGILLVRAGQKAEPFIEEALHRQLNLPQVLVMAGDIGAKKLEPELRKFAEHPDPKVSGAARDGLRILAAQKS